MTDEILVRRAVAADLEGAAELAGHLVRMHHDADPSRFFLPEQVEEGYASWFRRELERQAAVVLVAVRGNEVVGYAYGTLEGRDWNLLLDRHGAMHDVYVSEGVRQRGLGRQLINALITELGASILVVQYLMLKTTCTKVVGLGVLPRRPLSGN